ncbi:Uncharacterised protein [Kingella potus]|uniref:Beta-ketoacyl synthase N-terminal domain-containing protein n=1 Tax=Kingella potus TaxID=265175 RepID=A0A377R3T6_9NEIS|nr:Uncharacterised protein [Kingella potus]
MDILDLNIRITAAARLDTDAATPAKQLKAALQQQSGIDPRRFSRLSLIAALGAHLLKQNRPIAPDCAVYTAAPFSSPGVFAKMADNVFNHAAMPFDFIANLHNAPAFHAAQSLASSGATVFIPTGKQQPYYPLLAAALALDAGGQAAVGWCYEYQNEHRCTAEGSVWLLLEHGANTGATIRVRQNHTAPPCETAQSDGYYWQTVCDRLTSQPETESPLRVGDWDLLVGAADWAVARGRV